MDILEAREIYAHPNGHSREELRKCLEILNNAAQPVQLNRMQFLAIQDAIARTNGEDPRLP